MKLRLDEKHAIVSDIVDAINNAANGLAAAGKTVDGPALKRAVQARSDVTDSTMTAASSAFARAFSSRPRIDLLPGSERKLRAASESVQALLEGVSASLALSRARGHAFSIIYDALFPTTYAPGEDAFTRLKLYEQDPDELLRELSVDPERWRAGLAARRLVAPPTDLYSSFYDPRTNSIYYGVNTRPPTDTRH